MECKEFKKFLRKALKKKILDFLEENSAGSESENAVRNFFASALVKKEFDSADIVLSYVATETECDCSKITEKALSENKTVALPRVRPGTSEMDFYLLDPSEKIESQLEKGSFGILEPSKKMKKLEFSQMKSKKVFVVVPGVAFSESELTRLGHGKGFYDRYLSELMKNCESCFFCGVAFSCQKIEDLSFESFAEDSPSSTKPTGSESVRTDESNSQIAHRRGAFIPTDEFDVRMDAVIFS